MIMMKQLCLRKTRILLYVFMRVCVSFDPIKNAIRLLLVVRGYIYIISRNI